MIVTQKQRAFALTRWAVEHATRGEAVAVEIAVPARPVLGTLVDEGVLRSAVLLLERDGSHSRIAARPRHKGGATTITELFEEDHKRLDELAAQMRQVAHDDPMRAVVLAGLLAWGYRRHVRIEEEIVFPIHTARTRYAATTVRMHQEHVAILKYVDRIERDADELRIASNREPVITRLLDAEKALAAVVADHNEKEEHTLFPLLDHTVPAKERAAMLRKIVTF